MEVLSSDGLIVEVQILDINKLLQDHHEQQSWDVDQFFNNTFVHPSDQKNVTTVKFA